MIQFFCKCGQPFSVRPEFAGRNAPCPRCRQTVTVPNQSVAAPPGPGFGGPPPPPPSSGGGPVSGATAPYDRLAGPAVATPTTRAPVAAPGKPARLEVVHGPADVLGKVFSLATSKPATIGRDPAAEVTVPSDRVSRRHCRLEPQPNGAWLLADLGSSNGTLVNQVRIQRPQSLQGGEYIQTGDCLFRFVVG